MKPVLLLPLVAAVILTGCETPTPSLLSLESAATSQETLDRSLTGVWASDDAERICIIRAKESAYEIGYISGDSPRGVSARLIRAGDARIDSDMLAALRLLAPGVAVRAALEKYGTDERACSTQVTWQRMQ
ncbi:MAG: hypothetical protein LAQ30_23350 [Acidobacteriia bacterium]|nr:hypothetical protein [Terriglobia bacterium]